MGVLQFFCSKENLVTEQMKIFSKQGFKMIQENWYLRVVPTMSSIHFQVPFHTVSICIYFFNK